MLLGDALLEGQVFRKKNGVDVRSCFALYGLYNCSRITASEGSSGTAMLLVFTK